MASSPHVRADIDASYAPPPRPDTPIADDAPVSHRLAAAALGMACTGWLTCGVGSLLGVVLGFLALSYAIRQTSERDQSGLALPLAAIWSGILITVATIALSMWVMLLDESCSGTGGGQDHCDVTEEISEIVLKPVEVPLSIVDIAS